MPASCSALTRFQKMGSKCTNHIGHFLMTNLLLDKMKNTTRETGIEGRIVNLSSTAHIYTYEDGIPFDLINDLDSYSDKKAYGKSKLANIMHMPTSFLRSRLTTKNITSITYRDPRQITDSVITRFAGILQMFSYLLWKNVPQGAATTCYTSLHSVLKGVSGKYFLDCNKMEQSAFAKDKMLANKLWALSQKLVDSASKSAK